MTFVLFITTYCITTY